MLWLAHRTSWSPEWSQTEPGLLTKVVRWLTPEQWWEDSQELVVLLMPFQYLFTTTRLLLAENSHHTKKPQEPKEITEKCFKFLMIYSPVNASSSLWSLHWPITTVASGEEAVSSRYTRARGACWWLMLGHPKFGSLIFQPSRACGML